jgi:hypothetical protein
MSSLGDFFSILKLEMNDEDFVVAVTCFADTVFTVFLLLSALAEVFLYCVVFSKVLIH